MRETFYFLMLARAVRADLSLRLAPTDAGTLDRLLAGDTHFGETMVMSARHPADAAIGAIKGTANGFIGLADLIVRRSTLQNAAEIDNAAMMQALLGSHRGVEQAENLGERLHDLARRPMIDQIPYSNVAQAGGADIATVADAAMAASGLVTAGARLAVRGGGMAAEPTGPRIIEGIDARTLSRSHSIEGSRSIRNVDQMSEIMRSDGYAFDPVDVVQHDGGMFIVDGHHRAAAAIRTNTPVNVHVVDPDQFPMGSGGWQSIEEVIQSSQAARPNRLNPSGRRP